MRICDINEFMNSEIILEVAGKTLSGAMSFPEGVGKLMGAGVEF
jgi:hypothetical protein